jgi:hypothetical protein
LRGVTFLDEFLEAWDACSTSRLIKKGKILEYTDAPSVETETAPTSAEAGGKLETVEGKASDAVAVLLSVIPGVGHVYKGYRLMGLFIVAGAAFAILLGALAATATAGFGLALIPIYWFAVMFHVYAIPDRIAPGANDEGESY